MRKKKLLRQLFPTYLLIILVSLLAMGGYALNVVRQFSFAQQRADLEARADLVRGQAVNLLEESAGLDSACRLLGKTGHITLIDPSGKVVCDSRRDATRMDNHADRPEFRQAVAGQVGSATRFSNFFDEKMLYLAMPITVRGQLAGVVRTSVPVTFIDRALHSIQIRIALGGLAVALLAAAAGWFVTRRVTRSLEEIRRGAEQFADGDLAHKVAIPDSAEIGGLAEALNRMAAELNGKIQTATTQRNEKEAILSSMTEGVLAVDAEERIISLNSAAARLMGVHPRESRGRHVWDVVRNISLQKFISRTLASRNMADDDIILSFDGERFIQVRGALLRGAGDRGIGVLVVLNDVTRLRRLENTRREFVANVSHELKTPVTSIKGFVETLLAGAVRDPEKSKEFLAIVVKQADRLNAIIEDLLSLSRIEQESESDRIVLEETRLADVLGNAIQSCDPLAAKQNVGVELICDGDLRAKVNPSLLEHAVMNLIDNAAKYSRPGSAVEVRAARASGRVDIRVRDEGCGIGPEHLPRLFERFYRVDQARSRELGGTGLGLAIVKHIAQAHGGSVSVESAPGQGSTFIIHLPH
ncbi:MAG: ATP-binding protein [Nitrospinales bacterium]